ncbi:MAG TPA: hypothetical protein VMG38_24240 [Trebonia sp.]|nr:hypothetical protein [Trebonia sp.]
MPRYATLDGARAASEGRERGQAMAAGNGHAAVLLADRGVLLACDMLSDVLIPLLDPRRTGRTWSRPKGDRTAGPRPAPRLRGTGREL